MAEKINISDLKVDCFADKTVKRFAEELANAESTLRLGSIAALTAAEAAAMAMKAVRLTGCDDDADLKKAETDLETLRAYFVKIIDEENKARKPLEKRIDENASEPELEGGYLTACIMIDEVLYSSIHMMEALDRVADKICSCGAIYAAAAVRYARTAMESVRMMHKAYGARIKEPVCAHTVSREPEIAIAGNTELAEKLIVKFEGMIK